MLYVFVGSDFPKIKKRVAALTKGHEAVRFGEGGESYLGAPARLGATSIFSSKVALVLDQVFEDAEGKEMFRVHADEFADSDMPVIVVAVALSSEMKKSIPKKAVVESFEIEKEETPVQKIFALTDAFSRGDRKQTWVLYRKFIETGASPEEIHGMLAWQVRSLVLAEKANSASEAGLKPFVYTKAKSALKNLSQKPETLSRDLVALYHQSRMGQGSLEELLEMFLLKK